MSWTNTTDGDLEYRQESTLVSLLAAYQTIKDVFGTDTVNIRASRDTSTARAIPGISLESLCEQSIPNTNEYRCTWRFVAETDPYKGDQTGERVRAFIGAIRDYLHEDTTIAAINAAADDWRLNSPDSLHEASSEDDSILDGGNQIRRMILTANAWAFVGS